MSCGQANRGYVTQAAGVGVVTRRCLPLTQGRRIVDATAHGKHPIDATFQRGEPLGNDAQRLRPRNDVVIEAVVSHRDAVHASIRLHLPRHFLHLVGNLDQFRCRDGLLPVLFQGELEFAVRSHATESESGGRKLDHDADYN